MAEREAEGKAEPAPPAAAADVLAAGRRISDAIIAERTYRALITLFYSADKAVRAAAARAVRTLCEQVRPIGNARG